MTVLLFSCMNLDMFSPSLSLQLLIFNDGDDDDDGCDGFYFTVDRACF